MGGILTTVDLALDRKKYNEGYNATGTSPQAADITFGQLETSFAETGVRLPQARRAVLERPDRAHALDRKGFGSTSMAGEARLNARYQTSDRVELVA